MLEINPEKANASDGDVILRKSLFANDLRKQRKKIQNCTREGRPYLTLSTPQYSSFNYTPEKAERKLWKQKRQADVQSWIAVNSSFAYSTRITTGKPPSGRRKIAS